MPVRGYRATVANEVEQLSGQGRRSLHTLQSIHASINEACHDLEIQIGEIEQENSRALTEVQDVVGALSDLRQGRFTQSVGGGDMGEEVLATLRRLEAVSGKPAD